MRSTCSNTSFEVRAILLGQGKRKNHFAWDGKRKSDFCVAQPVKVITG